MNTITKQGFEIMDEAEAMVLGGWVGEGLTKLTLSFQKLRNEAAPEDWAAFAEREFLAHSFVNLVHQDPFTKHSFDKPRNYAGDADLIDFMYGIRQPDAETSELGRKIFDWAMQQSTVQSVRARREIIASTIDDLAEHSSDLRILSIACGHLREAITSQGVQNKCVSEFFALDQDALSLEVVGRELSAFNVKPIHAPIKCLFKRNAEFQNLDFVYAAGLYDYLPQKVAVSLTCKMFGMLKSGGRLLVANFAPPLRDMAYSETFMQWKLIYRNEAEVLDFASGIPPEAISNQHLFWDAPKNVIYLEIVKK